MLLLLFVEKDGSRLVGQTAYSLLSDSKIMSETCKRKMKANHEKFFPLEFDPDISHEQKYKYMDEWWNSSNQALLDERPTLATLFEAVTYAQLQLRPGFALVAQEAYRHDIPVVVFSAGITQVIEEILRQKGPTSLMLPNVHVIANDLEMDENNIITAFKAPLMHSLNKKDTSVKLVKELTHEWFAPMRRRKHVLLMGDNLGDADMSDGYEGDDDVVILKIGFLNSNVDAYLPQYRKAFDIVVLHDGPMVPVASFLKEIIGDVAPQHDVPVIPEQPLVSARFLST